MIGKNNDGLRELLEVKGGPKLYNENDLITTELGS
jgi:hypothetical protein